jgi:hypothetical protein
MNWADVRANWPPLREQVRNRWARLSDEEIAEIGGRRHELIGSLCREYGIDSHEAARQADEFVSALQVLSL